MTEDQRERAARCVKQARSHLKAVETSLLHAKFNGADVERALGAVLLAMAKVDAARNRIERQGIAG